MGNTAMTTSEDILTDIINHVRETDPTFGQRYVTRMPKYRYYCYKGSDDQYFWTVETVKHNGKDRYASGIYRYLKTKKQFKLTKERYHTKRKDAKARALKLSIEKEKP